MHQTPTPDKQSVSQSRHDPEEAAHPRMDITACLDAVDMYDAAYHRDRDIPTAEQPKPEMVPLKIVSLWEYLWATGLKMGSGLLGRGFLLTLLIAGALVGMNGVRNVYEYQRAQPTIHIREKPVIRRMLVPGESVPIVRKGANGPELGTESDTEANSSETWSEPSPYPLPPDWIQTNRNLYATLLLVMLLSRLGSDLCLQRARRINAGVPINSADTAHLPAQDSLVRASQEPVQEGLVRASSLPPTPPGVLLRTVGLETEKHEEQLLRAIVGGQE